MDEKELTQIVNMDERYVIQHIVEGIFNVTPRSVYSSPGAAMEYPEDMMINATAIDNMVSAGYCFAGVSYGGRAQGATFRRELKNYEDYAAPGEL
jgi:hypothetical protein